jgi:hypothetical protein
MRSFRDLVIWSWSVVLCSFAAAVTPASPQGRICACDHARPETLDLRQCSLCREAENQKPDTAYFFLKDINPRKPNRWLILPREHDSGIHRLTAMPTELSEKFWNAAVEKARSFWGSDWGLAVNGERSRTQCHAHVHIGKYLEGAEAGDFLLKAGGATMEANPPLVLRHPSEIQVPPEGKGFWLHAAGNGIHMHIDDSYVAAEFVLLR